MARTKQTARKTFFGSTGAFGSAQTTAPSKKAYPPPAPMTAEQTALIAQEDKYRSLFAQDRFSSELNDPHLLLVDAFANRDTFVYQEETPEEAAIPKLLDYARKRQHKKGHSITTRDVFLQRFKEFTGGVLDGLDWNNVFVAGGAVLANLINEQEECFETSDIDMFLTGFTTDEEANAKLKQIYDLVVKNSKGSRTVIRSHRAVTILGDYPLRHVQIILRLYKSPAEVLLGFDIDCCTAGFDGSNVWVAERFRRALNKSYNLINKSRRSLTYESRLNKYCRRGFAVAVPNLDMNRINQQILSKNTHEVQGLAKLILYEHYATTPNVWPSYYKSRVLPRRFTRFNRDGKNQDAVDIAEQAAREEGHGESDYSDAFIPWGPRWQSRNILAMLSHKDKANIFSGKSLFNGKPLAKPFQKGTETHHVHMYVTGIDGVLQGKANMFWCKQCKLQKPLEVDENGLTVESGPISWLKESPVYQDMDGGFRRNLGTGSFRPVMIEEWEKDVYDSSIPERGLDARPVPQPNPFFTQPDEPQAAGGFFSTGDINISCPTCHKVFVSHNTLNQHKLSSGHGLDEPFKPATPIRAQASDFYADSPSKFGGGSALQPQSPSLEAFGGGRSSEAVLATTSFAQPPRTPGLEAFGGGHVSVVDQSPVKSHASRNLFGEPAQPATTSIFQQQHQLQQLLQQQQQQALNWNQHPAGLQFANTNTGPVQAPSWYSALNPSGPKSNPTGPVMSNMVSQGLLLVGTLHRKGAIDSQERGALKGLVLKNDPLVSSVIEAFAIDNDADELVDTLKRVLNLKGLI